MSQPNLKILVAYHKPATLIKDDIFVPIHLGRALATEDAFDGKMDSEDLEWLHNNMIGDDTGDNISNKNRKYCELTAIYWAWKNYDSIGNPDYIGLVHYRRNFDLLQIRNLLSQDTLIIPKAWEVPKTIFEQYAQEHFVEDLQLAVSILKDKNPDYSEACESVLLSNKLNCYNMFVMGKEEFFKYAQWAFSIINEIEQKLDYSKYSYYQYRSLAFLAERLNSIYFLQQKNNLNIIEADTIYLNETDIPKKIKPAFKKKNIPIVFTCDNEYVKYLGVAIKSLINNSSPINNYDLIIVFDNITESNKKLLLQFEKNNVSIRFLDIRFYLCDIDLSIFHLNAHFKLSCYYRFFIPSIFENYDKILYLDCDIIIETDIAELFYVDIQNNIIGVAIDSEVQRLRNTDYLFNDYCSSKLGIKSSPYFQAGILLFNIKQSIEQNIQNKCLEKLKTFKPTFIDQCVLNSICCGQVYFLPVEWNLEWQIPFADKDYKKHLTISEYEEYTRAKKNLKIIHYSSSIKPWQYPDYELADRWWHYARQTPFYEDILFKSISRIESTKSDDFQASSTETSKLKYYKISQVFPFLRIVHQNNTKKFMLWRFIPVRKVVFDANKVHKYLFGIKYKTVETGQNITSNDNYVKTYSLAQVFPFLRIVEENNTRKFMLWRFIPVRKVVFDGDKVHKYLFGIKYRTVSR